MAIGGQLFLVETAAAAWQNKMGISCAERGAEIPDADPAPAAADEAS